MIFSRILSLSDIKKERFVIEHIRWDIEPKDLMEPRSSITESGLKTRECIKGYIFYIDTIDKNPALFLMRHTAADYAETLAQIDEIPQELLLRAVEENKDKIFFSMCPINREVEEWLKKELGVL